MSYKLSEKTQAPTLPSKAGKMLTMVSVSWHQIGIELSSLTCHTDPPFLLSYFCLHDVPTPRNLLSLIYYKIKVWEREKYEFSLQLKDMSSSEKITSLMYFSAVFLSCSQQNSIVCVLFSGPPLSSGPHSGS